MIEELGPRGCVDLSLGRSVFFQCVLWRVGPWRFISCIFKDVSYSSRSAVTIFTLHAAFYEKNVAGLRWIVEYMELDRFLTSLIFFVNRLVVRTESRCKVFIIWFRFMGYAIIFCVIVTWCFRQIADCRLANKWSDGAVVVQMFWFGMKDMISRIAEDIAGQGLDRDTFVLTLGHVSL